MTELKNSVLLEGEHCAVPCKGQPGDVGIVLNGGIIGRITLGKASHAFVISEVNNKNVIYETEAGMWGGSGQSNFVDIGKYNDKAVILFRPIGLTDDNIRDIIEVTHERAGTPYSLWDCAVNGVLNFTPLIFAPKIKQRLVRWAGTQRFTKCDEEVLTVLGKVLDWPLFKQAEEHVPQTLFLELLINSRFEIVARQIPIK